jgi:hypothetical protein
MKTRLISLFIITIILSSCGTISSVRHSVEYDKILNKSNKILILPSSVEVVTSDTLGKKDRQYNYEIYLSDIMSESLKSAIQNKGFRATILHKKDIIDKGIYKDISKLRAKYNEAREELYKTLLWDTEKAFSVSYNIGPEAIIVGEKTESGILLFADYVRNIKTTGSRTIAFIADAFFNTRSSDDVDSAVMFIGLVNAKDGKLLWLNFFKVTDSLIASICTNTGSDKKIDTDHLDRIIKGVLSELKLEISGN